MRGPVSNLLGVPAGLVQGTLGGAGNTSGSLTSGGGPGGTSTASGGAAAGAGGINVSTNGQGPAPEVLDPVLTGTLQLERTTSPQATPFGSGAPTLNQNTDTYNFNYNQGFVTGTQLQVAFNNTRITNNSMFNFYSPQLTFDLSRDADPASVEWLWSGHQRPLHSRSQEQPAHHRFCVSFADSLHH